MEHHRACLSHCCPVHGCKYGHQNCPVAARGQQPSYPNNNGCESCTPKSGIVIRVRWEQLGGHIHCRLFTARAANQTFANCGQLIFDETEWPSIRETFEGAGVEFIEQRLADEHGSVMITPKQVEDWASAINAMCTKDSPILNVLVAMRLAAAGKRRL